MDFGRTKQAMWGCDLGLLFDRHSFLFIQATQLNCCIISGCHIAFMRFRNGLKGSGLQTVPQWWCPLGLYRKTCYWAYCLLIRSYIYLTAIATSYITGYFFIDKNCDDLVKYIAIDETAQQYMITMAHPGPGTKLKYWLHFQNISNNNPDI